MNNSSTTINREKIAERLSNHFGLSVNICEEIVNNVFIDIYDLAKMHERVSIDNFGTWIFCHKKERHGFDMNRKIPANVPARDILKFLPSKYLKSLIKS